MSTARRRIASFVLVLVLYVLLSYRAYGNEQGGTAETAPAKMKEWSFAYSYIQLNTISGKKYDFNSVGLNYRTRNSWKVPMITSTTIFAPVAIAYNDEFFTNFTDIYKHKVGIDFMMGIELGLTNSGTWHLRLQPGMNIIGIAMPGKSGYYPFHSLTAGVALNLAVDKDWEQGLTVSFAINSSFQIFDLIHSADKLNNGYTMSFNIGIGFKDGAARGDYSHEK